MARSEDCRLDFRFSGWDSESKSINRSAAALAAWNAPGAFHSNMRL
jgi:hypothetical protein